MVVRAIAELINAIRELMTPLEPKKTNKESFGGNLPFPRKREAVVASKRFSPPLGVKPLKCQQPRTGYVGAKKRAIGFALWKEK